MFNKIILALLCNISLCSVFAQTYQPLKSGDLVPDLVLENVTNYKNKTIRISDFRGKWVIIDFWGDGCLSCVSGFPMLDSMQIRYKDQLQLILASKNSNDQLKAFISRLKNNPVLPDIPQITSETIWSQFFPHKAVPHHVWIDPEGKLFASTSSAHFIPDNLEKAFRGALERFPIEVFQTYNEYTQRSIWEKIHGKSSKGMYYSLFSKALTGLDNRSYSSRKSDTVNHTFRVSYSNYTLLNLIREIYPKKLYSSSDRKPTRLYYEEVDAAQSTLPLEYSYHNAWKEKNTYCYEIQVHASYFRDNMEKVIDMISRDINFYLEMELGITTKLEKRRITVYTLRAPNGFEKMRADPSKFSYKLFPNLQGIPFNSVLFWQKVKEQMAVQNIYLEEDFVNPDFLVDISLPDNWRNIDVLKKTLESYGLELTAKEVEEEVIAVYQRAH